MLQDSANHTRHASDRFQHDRAMTVSASEKGVGEKSHELDDSKCQPVAKALWNVVALQRRPFLRYHE